MAASVNCSIQPVYPVISKALAKREDLHTSYSASLPRVLK